jgi:hypothetical protein
MDWWSWPTFFATLGIEAALLLVGSVIVAWMFLHMDG